MRRSSLGPTVDQLPIPPDARPNGYWTQTMMDMEAVVGAYATLLIVDEYGGDHVDIPKSIDHAAELVDLVGDVSARAFLQVYGGERLYISLAPDAIKWAKSAPIVEDVKAGRTTVSAAARRLRMKRTTLSAYLNNKAPKSMTKPPDPRRQFDLFKA